MGPVDLVHLFHELRSPNAATVEIPADELTPGRVIATGEWNKHVVTAVPDLLSAKTLSVPVRHLHGGHTLTRRFRRTTSVTVYAQTLRADYVRDVLTIPRCFVPEDPETGDRVYQHFHDVLRLGEGQYFEYDGTQWRKVTDSSDGYRSRATVTYYDDIRHLVSSPSDSSPYAWFTFQPAGHRPFLYVDGLPMPARRAEELIEGDVLRFPGGGRLTVRRAEPSRIAVGLSLELTGRSIHELRHFAWARSVGDVIEHSDSGRTSSLYATEPRPSELLAAAELQHGDTVITSWGSRRSAVALVEEVWRQPVRGALHLHTVTTDGRLMREQSYPEPHHFVLHRPAGLQHSTAGYHHRACA